MSYCDFYIVLSFIIFAEQTFKPSDAMLPFFKPTFEPITPLKQTDKFLWSGQHASKQFLLPKSMFVEFELSD